MTDSMVHVASGEAESKAMPARACEALAHEPNRGDLKATEAVGETPTAVWTPQIVAIVCNWCTYAGADMAGTTRRTYPANIRMLRVPCSGRVNPLFILKSFEQGADGVLVSGCHPGDCHYVQGNYFARRRFTAFRALLDFLGLDAGRLHFSWVSASEGIKWASVVEDVTKAVQAAGPLRDWGRALTPSTVTLPDVPAAPRDPSAEDHATTTAHIRDMARSLLREGKATTIVGWVPGPMPGQMIPGFVTSEADTDRLAWNDRCHTNLTTYLAGPNKVTEKVPEKTGSKIAVFVKQCDARSVRALLQEAQIPREDVVLIGVSCAGVTEEGRLSRKCYACDGDVIDICDYAVSAAGVQTGAVVTNANRATAPDPRDAEIAYLESLPHKDRWGFWQEQFADCIRCYACRAVCPMCYCGSCITEQHRPQWIPTSINGKGNTAWNLVRAYHLAGRCVGCDECERVCPANIRLDLINRRLALEVERRFDYRAGEKTEGGPPLTAFKPEDPQEFIL